MYNGLAEVNDRCNYSEKEDTNPPENDVDRIEKVIKAKLQNGDVLHPDVDQIKDSCSAGGKRLRRCLAENFLYLMGPLDQAKYLHLGISVAIRRANSNFNVVVAAADPPLSSDLERDPEERPH